VCVCACVLQSGLAAVSSRDAFRKTGKVTGITIVLTFSMVLTKLLVPNSSNASDTC